MIFQLSCERTFTSLILFQHVTAAWTVNHKRYTQFLWRTRYTICGTSTFISKWLILSGACVKHNEILGVVWENPVYDLQSNHFFLKKKFSFSETHVIIIWFILFTIGKYSSMHQIGYMLDKNYKFPNRVVAYIFFKHY